MKNKKYVLALLPLLLLVSCDKGTNENQISAIDNLKSTGIDEGVVLSWKSDDNALSYVIYQDENKVGETDNNFYTIHNLNNNQNYNLGVQAKYASTVSKISYISSKPEAGKDYDPFIDDLNTGLEKRIGNSKIKEMLEAGDVNTSATNISRFKKVINKMKGGESQTIAYIGGSITVGEKATAFDNKNHQKGYAYYSYSWLKEHYDKNKNSLFINASISGTDSSIATVRLEKDVLQYNPDLVFVEFCANNGSSIFDKKTYESLIRRILLQDNNPAVVLLFSAVDYAINNQDGYMKPMGDYYHLPMFSCLNALKKICGNIDQDLSDPIYKFFSADGVHPNDQGHKLYAKNLVYVLKKIINSELNEESYVVPTNPWSEGYDCFVNFNFVNNQTNSNSVKSLGSFEAKDTSCRVLKDTADVEAFQNGWVKSSRNSNDALVFEVTCKNFFIIYLAGNPDISGDPEGKMIASYQNKDNTADNGSLKWDVGRTQKQTRLETIVDNGHGWQNPCCIILFDNVVNATYTISIKMENISDLGTVLAVGYTN